jgi:hypothetical protein
VACGVPANESAPRDIAADNVQFDLLAPSSTSTSTTIAPTDVRTVEVFLVRNEQLAPRERRLPANVDAAGVIRELLVGTQGTENQAGFSTAIPEGTELLDASLDDQVLTLDVSEELNAVQGERQMTAIAQMVFTATELRGVDGVRFQIEGSSVEVPKGDGTLTSSPVNRSDYPDLDRESD